MVEEKCVIILNERGDIDTIGGVCKAKNFDKNIQKIREALKHD